ncbi:MAG: DUF4405 domain-containing protein [Verrucomicrobiota bacterium]
MSLRKITSLTALLSFILMIITSIVLYIAPFGRHSGRWQLLGLEKGEWKALHVNLGILFLVVGIIHVVLNLKPIILYLKNKNRKLRVFTLSFTIATLITFWIVVSTLFNLPPVNTIQRYRQGRKHVMDNHGQTDVSEPKTKPFPDRPPFRFGSRTFTDVCEEYGLDRGAALQELRRLGIEAQADWSIKAIAEKNDMALYSVFEAIRQLQDQ